MPIRLLVVFDSPAKYFSAQVRGLQYKELFDRSAVVRADFATRQSDEFNRWIARFKARQWGGSFARILDRVHRRVIRQREQDLLKRAASCDVAYLIKVPVFDFHTRLCALPHLKVVLDVNDALWLPLHRADGYERAEEMMQSCDALFCENSYLLERGRRHNPNAYLIPDCPQLEAFDRRRGQVVRPTDRVVLGWVGSDRTADALCRIFEPLEELFKRHAHLHLRVVGAAPENLPRFERVRFSCRPAYGQGEMVEEVLGMHIGLFPLFDVEDSYARGNLKAKIYMAGGSVVVCQNLGDNASLIVDGRNGVLASTPDEWLRKLDWLVTSPAEHDRIAQAGLETIRSEYTIERCFQRLEAAFAEVAQSTGTARR